MLCAHRHREIDYRFSRNQLSTFDTPAMSSAISLVSKFLTGSQKVDLVKTLASGLEKSENATILSELIAELDSSTIDEIYPLLLEFAKRAATGGDPKKQTTAILFISLSLRLCTDILSFLHGELKRGIISHFSFVTGYANYVNDVCDSESLESSPETILNLFEFLTLLFTQVSVPSSEVSTSTDELLCLYLGHNDDKISSLCSKLIRWRVSQIIAQAKKSESRARYMWSIVFKLIETGTSKRHRVNAFIIWLRIVNCDSADFKHDQFFQNNIINLDSYWEVLQNGLVSNSHEVRKFCLSILQLSLKAIATSFTSSILSWDTADEKNLLADWSRYTTVFEILGIDTSLHQTQAAVNDILSLISKDSLIHPSWGFCLLSTGFQASMDSVRKYSMQILLSIKDENLLLVRYALPYLENTFLPYMMLSRHFAVRPVKQHSNDLQCTYGEKFSNFLCQVVANLNSDDEIQEVCFSILTVLNNSRESFDAVRIYATLGLVRGLGSRRALKFGVHDQLLLRLFDNFSEGELYKTAVQTLNLKLILQFGLDSFNQFAELISSFNSFNGYEIFAENIEEIARYVHQCGVSSHDLIEHFNSTTVDAHKVVVAWIATSEVFGMAAKLEDLLKDENDQFLVLLLQTGLNVANLAPPLKERTEKIFERAAENDLDTGLFATLAECKIPYSQLVTSKCSLSKLYSSIKQDIQSDDYGVLSASVQKLRFMNNYIGSFGLCHISLSVEEFVELKRLLFCNSSACAKTVTDFYKLKEAAVGEYHRTLAAYVANSESVTAPQSSAPQQILDLLTFGSTHFTTLYSICSVLEQFFNCASLSQKSLEYAIVSVSESIDELNSERFKLSDKELHAYLIDIMLHPCVLECTIASETINDAVSSFCNTMLVNSYGRRGIFTRMMLRLSAFQVSHSEVFEQIPFIAQFLVRACCHRQLQHSAFKLEGVIGKLYDAQLNPTTTNIYEKVYGVDEVAGKVWTLAILNSVTTESCARAIIDCAFQKDNQFSMFDIVKATDGVEEHYRTQLVKAIVSVADKVDLTYSTEHYYPNYIYLVENDPSPLVRVYAEWLVAMLLLRKPDLAEKFFDKLVPSLEAHELKPTLVTIYERILYLMVQSMAEPLKTQYLTRLITIILPAASTNKAITRHFSMSLAVSVYQEIEQNHLKLEPGLLAVVTNMYKSALASEAFGQYRSGDALLWDIVKDLNLVQISGGLLIRLFDRDVEFISREDFNKYLTKDQQTMLAHPVGHNNSELWVSELKNGKLAVSALQEFSEISQSPLQTKSGAWSTVMDVDEGGPEVVRSDLIVVASLVDKPPNLGGICRLCDVLGAGTLTLHDMKVKEHQQFKNVAVTADHWMPMVEVKPESIVEYLRQQKARGYTLIGLEQTDKSVVLDSNLQFPKKSLILLGREKEGIPGELLAELDLCVEINQVGVIRSMNIQTATAVIVHAYSCQHC